MGILLPYCSASFFGKSPKSGQLILLSIEETPILEPLTTCFCKQIAVWKYIIYSSWTNWDIEMQNKKMSILRLQNRMVCNWSIPTRQYENQTRPRLQTKKIILENSLSNKFQKRPRQLKTQNFISANNFKNEPNSVSTNDIWLQCMCNLRAPALITGILYQTVPTLIFALNWCYHAPNAAKACSLYNGSKIFSFSL